MGWRAAMEYILSSVMVCMSLLDLRIFGCSLVHFSLRGSGAFLSYWGGVLLDGVSLSWKPKERREMTEEEEAWNRNGINPKRREHAGKDYRSLLHIPSTNAKYVKLPRVWLKRSNSSSGAVRRHDGVDYFDIRPWFCPNTFYKSSNNVLKMETYGFLFHSFCWNHPIGTYRPRDIFRDLHALITFPGAYHNIRCTKQSNTQS